MIDYIALQNEAIKKFNAVIVQNSECWSRMHAHCKDNSRRICKWKQVNSYSSLFDLLHEIGHLETWNTALKRCESESQATKWAIERLKEFGLPIKRKKAQAYKDYIARTYQRGVRRRLQKKVKSKLYM
jgi:hypothetical protein